MDQGGSGAFEALNHSKSGSTTSRSTTRVTLDPPRCSRSLEVIVEPDGAMLAELRLEPAVTAKAFQVARSGSRNHEPIGLDLLVDDRSTRLEQKRPPAPPDRAAHPLDPDEARRAVLAGRLNDTAGPLPFDVAAEHFGDLDFHQRRAVGDLVERRGNVRFDFGVACGAVFLLVGH